MSDEVFEFAGHSDAFYGRPEEHDRVYFDPATASHLMKCEAILDALMNAGVHNFEGYDEAMENFKKGWKQ